MCIHAKPLENHVFPWGFSRGSEPVPNTWKRVLFDGKRCSHAKKGGFRPKQALSGPFSPPLPPGSNIGVFQPEGPKKGPKKGQKGWFWGWFWVEKGVFHPKQAFSGPVGFNRAHTLNTGVFQPEGPKKGPKRGRKGVPGSLWGRFPSDSVAWGSLPKRQPGKGTFDLPTGRA